MLMSSQKRKLDSKMEKKSISYEERLTNYKKLRYDMYIKYCEEAENRKVQNIEQQDKQVLTLSNVAIGFLLLVFRDYPSSHAHLLSLGGSLICFTLAITLVFLSYWSGVRDLNTSMVNAKKYYIDEDETAFNSKTWMTQRLTGASALFFVLGIVWLLFFCFFFSSSKGV